MFSAISIEKGEAGQTVTVASLDEAELPDGDVSVDVEYSTLNYKDGLAITGKSPSSASSRWCRVSTLPALSPKARTRTGRRATASCSTAGAWAKPTGAAWPSAHA